VGLIPCPDGKGSQVQILLPDKGCGGVLEITQDDRGPEISRRAEAETPCVGREQSAPEIVLDATQSNRLAEPVLLRILPPPYRCAESQGGPEAEDRDSDPRFRTYSARYQSFCAERSLPRGFCSEAFRTQIRSEIRSIRVPRWSRRVLRRTRSLHVGST
jgi:hypothetical protein